MRLQKAVTAVNHLYEVVELIVNSEKNHAVTMPLEIAPAPRQLLFRRKDTEFSVGEVDCVPLTHVHVLRSVDFPRFRQSLFDCLPLIFEVVPDDKMIVRRSVDNLLCLCHACGDAVPLFPRRLREPLRRVMKHLELPVLLFGYIQRPSQFVIAHLEFG